MIAGELLQHVPGCEDGEPPFSQEMIGGGKVNHSFLVRTRRGRFVVRLNENTGADPGLDRDRELALHTAAAGAGIAPQVVYAAPDRSCLITDYVDGRLWTPHYFTRMRDLRSLGQRLRTLHALPPPPVTRFDPLSTARRYADLIVAQRPRRGRAHPVLVSQRRRSADAHRLREARAGHRPQRPASRQCADRGSRVFHRLGICAGRRSAARSRLHHDVLPARACRTASCCWKPRASTDVGTTPAMLAELTNVFTLLTYLWYRARRVGRNVPATDLQIESAALRRLLSLAPDAQPRHTSAANLRESS